jgi:hypothetical protein
MEKEIIFMVPLMRSATGFSNGFPLATIDILK